MLGLDDRVAMREPAVDKSDSKIIGQKDRQEGRQSQTGRQACGRKTRRETGWRYRRTAKPDDKPVDTELSPEDAADNDATAGHRAGEEHALAERPL